MLNPLPLDELTAVFARIKGLLLTEEKVDRAVQLLVQAVSEAIPGTAGAGISLLDAHGHGTSIGATNALVLLADHAQHGLGQGPCVAAWTEGVTVHAHDAEWGSRWPLWSEAVGSLTVRSVVSAPLLTAGSPVGTLKIYAAQPDAYAEGTGELLEKFAVPAGTEQQTAPRRGVRRHYWGCRPRGGLRPSPMHTAGAGRWNGPRQECSRVEIPP